MDKPFQTEIVLFLIRYLPLWTGWSIVFYKDSTIVLHLKVNIFIINNRWLINALYTGNTIQEYIRWIFQVHKMLASILKKNFFWLWVVFKETIYNLSMFSLIHPQPHKTNYMSMQSWPILYCKLLFKTYFCDIQYVKIVQFHVRNRTKKINNKVGMTCWLILLFLRWCGVSRRWRRCFSSSPRPSPSPSRWNRTAPSLSSSSS